MILYRTGNVHMIFNILRWKGSVFPSSLMVALPCAGIAALLQHFTNEGLMSDWEKSGALLRDNSIWSSFSAVVGFLVVFRTSQAYSRFWEGCSVAHTMAVWWFNATSGLCAFTKFSKEPPEKIEKFKNLLIRLVSILHVSALSEIEECNTDCPEDIQAFNYNLIDPMALDDESLRAIQYTECKPELVYQWIQGLVVENIQSGVLAIPPPILSRSFQELSHGMVALQEAVKLSNIPFPFPYAQTCDCLLLIHWLLTPLVVSSRGNNVWWSALFCVVQVFIIWTLNLIAVEIENPFGYDANDLDAGKLQNELNKHLCLFLTPAAHRTPVLREKKDLRRLSTAGVITGVASSTGSSLIEVWESVEAALGGVQGRSTRHVVSEGLCGGAPSLRGEQALKQASSKDLPHSSSSLKSVESQTLPSKPSLPIVRSVRSRAAAASPSKAQRSSIPEELGFGTLAHSGSQEKTQLASGSATSSQTREGTSDCHTGSALSVPDHMELKYSMNPRESDDGSIEDRIDPSIFLVSPVRSARPAVLPPSSKTCHRGILDECHTPKGSYLNCSPNCM